MGIHTSRTRTVHKVETNNDKQKQNTHSEHSIRNKLYKFSSSYVRKKNNDNNNNINNN